MPVRAEHSTHVIFFEPHRFRRRDQSRGRVATPVAHGLDACRYAVREAAKRRGGGRCNALDEANDRASYSVFEAPARLISERVENVGKLTPSRVRASGGFVFFPSLLHPCVAIGCVTVD